MQMKVFVVNDTSVAGHSGSRAVMDSLYYRITEAGGAIIGKHMHGEFSVNEQAFTKADIVVANGEGVIHHRQQTGIFIMDTLRRAQMEGKKTALVNALIQEDPPYFEDVFHALDYCSTRDPWSLQAARRLGASAQLLLDSCVDPVFAYGGVTQQPLPPIVVSDTHFNAPIQLNLHDLGYRGFYLNGLFRDVVRTLSQCSVYVTARYHGVYAAALAGVAVIAVPSNSWKIESLAEWWEADFPICHTLEEIREVMPLVLQDQDAGTRLRRHVVNGPFLDVRILRSIFS
jgi:polysaccharide pyruvyl transferase WcaK-like protein